MRVRIRLAGMLLALLTEVLLAGTRLAEMHLAETHWAEMLLTQSVPELPRHRARCQPPVTEQLENH